MGTACVCVYNMRQKRRSTEVVGWGSFDPEAERDVAQNNTRRERSQSPAVGKARHIKARAR